MDNYYTELRNHHAVCKKKTWDNELRLQKNRKPNDNASVKQQHLIYYLYTHLKP